MRRELQLLKQLAAGHNYGCGRQLKSYYRPRLQLQRQRRLVCVFYGLDKNRRYAWRGKRRVGHRPVQYRVGQRARRLLKLYNAVVRLKKHVERHVPPESRKRAELRRNAFDGSYKRMRKRGFLKQCKQLVLLWL